MEKYRGQELERLAMVEQDLATGVTAEGGKIKKDKVLAALEEILTDDSVPSANKTRLLMVHLTTEGAQPSDRVRPPSLPRRVASRVSCRVVCRDH